MISLLDPKHGFLNHVDSLMAFRSLLQTSHLPPLWTDTDTVLRYHISAMSAPSCHLGSFRLVSLVLLVSNHRLLPFGSAGVVWGLTGTNPCDDSPRHGGEPLERQIVLSGLRSGLVS